jgi:hypothetical protein
MTNQIILLYILSTKENKYCKKALDGNITEGYKNL